jgi:hypothetical protein
MKALSSSIWYREQEKIVSLRGGCRQLGNTSLHKDFKSGLYSIMGGRFGKYSDLKRRNALQRGRREKAKLERANLTSLDRRS